MKFETKEIHCFSTNSRVFDEKKSNKAVLFVQAYGSYDPQVRDEIEWKGIKQYTMGLMELISMLLTVFRYEHITLSFYGGMLDSKGRREAATWMGFAEDLQRHFGEEKVSLLPPCIESVWTGAIIKSVLLDATAEMISADYLREPPPDFYLICDEVRALKNKCMLLRIKRLMRSTTRDRYGKKTEGYWKRSKAPHIEVLGLPREDSHKNSRMHVQLAEIAYHFLFPRAFEKKMLKARKRHLPENYEFPR